MRGTYRDIHIDRAGRCRDGEGDRVGGGARERGG